jgi:hypothetical protein
MSTNIHPHSLHLKLNSLVAFASFFVVATVASGQKKDMPRENVIEIPAIGEGLCSHNLFQSNMVLQRDKPIQIWGWASPEEKVSVSFADQTQRAEANKDRLWKITLPAMSANAEPQTLTVKGKAKLRHAPSHIIDLAPTCLSAAGLSVKGMEGKSLLPVFPKDSMSQRTLYWEHEGNRAVRKGNHKLVAIHYTPWKLYDLSKDRSELNDLSETMPKKTDDLRLAYETWAKRVGTLPWNEVNVKKSKKQKMK